MSLFKQLLWKGFAWIMYMDLVLIAAGDRPICGMSEILIYCRPPACCKVYQVDRVLNNCSTCLPGYHGNQCQLPCRYPSYGQHCQLECKCDQGKCHFINGCTNSSLADRKTQNHKNGNNFDENLTPSDDRKENQNTQKDENISTTETTSTWAKHFRRTSDKVSTFAVQDENDPFDPFIQHLQQHLPLYVCFVIILLSASLNVVFLVKLLKNKRRIVKLKSVDKNEDTNEDEYVNLRSQLRSDVMYTNMQRKEGASYLEIEEINMRSMHGVPPL